MAITIELTDSEAMFVRHALGIAIKSPQLDARQVERTDGTWTCMVGRWPDPDAEEPEMTKVSTTATSWPEARRWMLNQLAMFVDDECPDCRQDGVQAIVHLVTERSPSYRWHVDIDGDDYWILYRPSATPNTDGSVTVTETGMTHDTRH